MIELEDIIEDETRRQWKATQKQGFQRFYSLPPSGYDYPWILRNIKEKERDCVHEIVDIGIYDLLKPPHKHTKEKIKTWKNLKTNGWKVVPDCPDLKGEELGKIKFGPGLDCTHDGAYPNFDTVEYSWELLTELYDPSNIHHLPVIQCHYGNVKSLKNYIYQFKREYGVVEKVALGSCCKINNKAMVFTMHKIMRKEFPTSWIHSFGLRFQHFRKVYRLIDSYDSMSWTFSRKSVELTCSKKQECIKYFNNYLKGLEPFISENQLKLEVNL